MRVLFKISMNVKKYIEFVINNIQDSFRSTILIGITNVKNKNLKSSSYPK